MKGLMPLIALIVNEISLIFVGVILVPIFNETKHKKHIKYIFPIFILIGLAELVIYIAFFI